VNDILRDRVLRDLIEQLDRVRGDFERAADYELPHFRTLIDNALRTVIDHLIEQRERRLVKNQ
jgi:hypothetical protein